MPAHLTSLGGRLPRSAVATVDLSIIIPTFRRLEPLREALNSILCLQGLSFEVLVVDDSPEGCAQTVVESFQDERVHYSRQGEPSGGRPAVLRNRAARLARGQVLYFLDDDDRAIAANVQAGFARLVASSAGVLVSSPRPFGPRPARVQEEVDYFTRTLSFFDRARSARAVTARLLFSNPLLVCSTCMVKASAFAQAGGFDESIPLCEDVEFYLRTIREMGFVYQPEPILERRIGEKSLISDATSERVHQSYQMIQGKYRQAYGGLEYWLLKTQNKLFNLT
jgi:glycosyltransferase involved in cell wall biosynthesis